jgi:hypothetical protein
MTLHPLTLGRVTVLAPGTDPGARGRIGRAAAAALDHAALSPSGLPPGALLIVRRLDDPLPGELLSAAPWIATRVWNIRARAAVERCWQAAARPAYESVPGDAPAVWFADFAEWLACFSWDAAHGLAGRRWWWQAWLRRGYAPSLAALWHDEVRWLPPALALLTERRGRAALTLLSRLTPAEAAAVRRAVCADHHLPVLPVEHPAALAEIVSLLPPRLAALIEGAPHAETLALILAAHYAPTALRRLAAGWGSRSAPPPFAADFPARRFASSPVFDQTDTPINALTPDDQQEKSVPDATPQTFGSRDAAHFAQTRRQDMPETDFSVSASAEDAPTPHVSRAEMPPLPSADLIDSPPLMAGSVDVSPAASTEIAAHLMSAGVHSACGGVWYLLNLMDALGWFAAPLSPWLLLAALARRLLHDAKPDPLWALLAELSEARGDPHNLSAAAGWLDAGRFDTAWAWLAAHLEQPDALPAKLMQPAQLFITRTHIDILFSLEQIDLDLRRAGLDRDPGWVAALARVVTFHFE